MLFFFFLEHTGELRVIILRKKRVRAHKNPLITNQTQVTSAAIDTTVQEPVSLY
jgi:hypothetical protein